MKKILTILALIGLMITPTLAGEFTREATYQVDGEFNGKMYESFNSFMKGLDKSVDTIHLKINSPGGSVFVLANMVSLIREFPGKVITYNESFAASCGFLLFLEGDERIGYHYSIYMAHGVSFGTRGKVEQFEETAKFLHKLNELMVDRLMELGLTEELIRKEIVNEKDNFLTTPDMKDLGLLTDDR